MLLNKIELVYAKDFKVHSTRHSNDSTGSLKALNEVRTSDTDGARRVVRKMKVFKKPLLIKVSKQDQEILVPRLRKTEEFTSNKLEALQKKMAPITIKVNKATTPSKPQTRASQQISECLGHLHDVATQYPPLLARKSYHPT